MATFTPIPAAISFAGLTALILEFTCATQAGAVAAGLSVFDEDLLARGFADAVCGYGSCRGRREDKAKACGR
jgi:hypothetical protein